jgi:hypothetical protein
MRNGSNKEEIKTHILCSINFFLKIAPFKKQCGKTWYSQMGQIYNKMLRRKDALRTLEEEKNADTVSSFSVLTALQMINFIRFHKTF